MEISWLTFILAMLTMLFVGIGYGSTRHGEYRALIEWVMQDNRQIASALRDIYDHFDLQYPVEDPGDPPPTRWQRFRAYLNEVPQTMERSERVPEPEVVDAELVEDEPDEPEPERRPAPFPATRPDTYRAVKVSPPPGKHAWLDEQYEKDMAAIRAIAAGTDEGERE